MNSHRYLYSWISFTWMHLMPALDARSTTRGYFTALFHAQLERSNGMIFNNSSAQRFEIWLRFSLRFISMSWYNKKGGRAWARAASFITTRRLHLGSRKQPFAPKLKAKNQPPFQKSSSRILRSNSPRRAEFCAKRPEYGMRFHVSEKVPKKDKKTMKNSDWFFDFASPMKVTFQP